MLGTTLTTEDKVIKAKIMLNDSHPFFAYILMNMKITADKKGDLPCPTMGVDRTGHLIYNEQFVESLNQDTLKGVLAHEAMHVATLTFKRQGHRNPQLWNIATDYIINWLLVQENLKLPEGGCIADSGGNIQVTGKGGKNHTYNVKDKTAEELYDFLESIAEKIDMSGCWGDGGKGMGSKRFDHHSDKAGKQKGDGKEDGDGEGQGQGEGDNEGDMSLAEINQNDNNWKQKCAEAAVMAKSRGKLGGAMQRSVGEVLEPVVDWRKKLYNFITNELPHNFSMKRPGRRFHATGVYSPIVLKENLKIEIGIDVSGSISEKELSDFAGEVIGICNGFPAVEAKVFWWSTTVTDGDELKLGRGSTANDFKKHSFNSTGGTTMSCIYDYFERNQKRPRVCVILTDGYVESHPKLPEGVKYIFVISKGGHGKNVEDLGDVCYLSKEVND